MSWTPSYSGKRVLVTGAAGSPHPPLSPLGRGDLETLVDAAGAQRQLHLSSADVIVAEHGGASLTASSIRTRSVRQSRRHVARRDGLDRSPEVGT